MTMVMMKECFVEPEGIFTAATKLKRTLIYMQNVARGL